MVFKVVMVIKLMRNFILALAISYFAYAFRSVDVGVGVVVKCLVFVLGFLIVFVVMVVLCLFGDVMEFVCDDARWKRFYKATGDFAFNVVLLIFMVVVGLCMSVLVFSGVGVVLFVVGVCVVIFVGVVVVCSVKVFDVVGAFRGIGAS